MRKDFLGRRLAPSWKRPHRSPCTFVGLYLCHRWGLSKKMVITQPGSKHSVDTKPESALILDLPTCRTVRKTFLLCISHSECRPDGLRHLLTSGVEQLFMCFSFWSCVCLNIFSLLNCLSYYWVMSFFIYSGYKCFVNYICCEYFFSVCSFLLHFLNSILEEQTFYISMKYGLFFFPYILCYKKSMPILGSWNFLLPILSSLRSFLWLYDCDPLQLMLGIKR